MWRIISGSDGGDARSACGPFGLVGRPLESGSAMPLQHAGRRCEDGLPAERGERMKTCGRRARGAEKYSDLRQSTDALADVDRSLRWMAGDLEESLELSMLMDECLQ